jgi:hypothetical protein
MSKFDVDSIKSMTMTDDGIQFELDESEEEDKELGEEEEEQEYELADDDSSTGEDDEEEAEEKPSRSKSKSDDNIEARFNRIEGLIDKMATAIVDGRGKAKITEEEEEDLEDLDDPKKLLSTIEKRVAKIIDNRLAPHQDAMQAATVRSQFDAAAGRYGQTFIDAAPLVARLMLASKGSMSVEEAYDELKKNGIVKSVPRKTKQQVIKEKKQVKSDADDEEVVTTGNRVPLRKKGRSVKESAMEALKKLSRGEL